MTSIHDKQYKELISRLKCARKTKGYTQEYVATLLNKPQSYLSKIETCQRRLDILELKELSEIYEVKVDDLL